jgi:hypothetical protein
MDCRGAEKGNLARELGAHHCIDSRAENPDNAPAADLTQLEKGVRDYAAELKKSATAEERKGPLAG